MNKILQRRFSARELILLGLLIVLAAYYFLVQGPVKTRTEELEAEKATLETEIQISEAKVEQKRQMQQELEEIFAAAAPDEPLALPDYNHVNNVILELNAILADTNSYNVTFGNEQFDSYIVRRPVTIQFEVNDYETARGIIEQINTSNNQYLIKDLTVTDGVSIYTSFFQIFDTLPETYEYNGRVSVNLSLTCFEYNPEN